jgi:hypothetical protein
MYWALAELPQPLVDMRPAARFELTFVPRIFPFIVAAESTDHSAEEWNRLYKEAVRNMAMLDGGRSGESTLQQEMAAVGLALAGYSHAKEWLVEHGMDRQRVEQMAVGQVLAVYTERNYRLFADDQEKLWYMPFWEMRRWSHEVEARLESADPNRGGPDREVLPVASLLLPAMRQVRTAQVRIQRDTAALQVIEALRMYAAGHGGRLPAVLEAISEVPLPLNPATGRPFLYRLDGDTAILDLPASEGFPSYSRRFEIRIAEAEQ